MQGSGAMIVSLFAVKRCAILVNHRSRNFSRCRDNSTIIRHFIEETID